MASYSELGFPASVSCVNFHPHDHMVAFSSLSEDSPVHIYKYDHQSMYAAELCSFQSTVLCKIAHIYFVYFILSEFLFFIATLLASSTCTYKHLHSNCLVRVHCVEIFKFKHCTPGVCCMDEA